MPAVPVLETAKGMQTPATDLPLLYRDAYYSVRRVGQHDNELNYLIDRTGGDRQYIYVALHHGQLLIDCHSTLSVAALERILADAKRML